MSKQGAVPTIIKVFGFQVERVLPQPLLRGEHRAHEPWRFERERDEAQQLRMSTAAQLARTRSTGHRS